VARGEWDEALDYVADRLVAIYQRDGSHAMACLLLRQGHQRGQLPAAKAVPRALPHQQRRSLHAALSRRQRRRAAQLSLGTTAMSNTASEVIHNDCFIVTGSNTTENHPIIALQMKEAVREHGAKLIVIDPRRLELCDYATLWLPLKPGDECAGLSMRWRM
jgi:predicted molibdopterin-dependent oxidoreductase YjgC